MINCVKSSFQIQKNDTIDVPVIKNLSLLTKLLELNDYHETLIDFDIEYRALSNRHIIVRKLFFQTPSPLLKSPILGGNI